MGRKKNNINTFACPVEEDNNDICGFSDEPIIKGKCLSSFSFDDSNINEEINQLKNHNHEKVISNKITFTDSTADYQNIDSDNNSSIITNPTNTEIKTDNSNNTSVSNQTVDSNTELFDNRRTPIANGAAPAIDGETPSIRRCYILRESTIRKINELKMMDNDISVCVSTIVDLAIDYYYKTISSSNLSSSN